MNRYHYTECGLSDVYLNNGFIVEEEDGETCIGVEGVDGLHQLIGRILTEKTMALTGEQIRFLRVEMGLSQKVLATMLDVDSQTVARWEKDQVAASRVTDITLRALYLESINHESRISFLVKVLAESEEKTAIADLVLENEGHLWKQAV